MKRLPVAVFLGVVVLSTTGPVASAQDADGRIIGVVVDSAGNPLADQRVQLRIDQTHLRQVKATAANGQFDYPNLGPGHYEVEWVIEGRVVTTSGPLELSARAMRVTGVILARPAPPPVSPPQRPRVRAEELLAGRPVTTSFDDLRAVLEPGHEIAVRDTAGRTARGRVSSISPDQVLIIQEPRLFGLFRSPQVRTFPVNSVARIDVVDSTAQGLLIGAAVGAALMFAIVQMEKDELATSNLKPLGYVAYGVLSFVPSMVVGQSIDRRVNEPVYERRPQARRVTLLPLLGRGGIGITAQVNF